MFWLYQIFCSENVIYIGVSSNIHHRIHQHLRGRGAQATRKYKPLTYKLLALFGTSEDAKQAERKLVLLLKNSNKFKLVFGSGYTITTENGG